MLLSNKGIKVSTLKNLKEDILFIYKKKKEEIFNNEEKLEEYIKKHISMSTNIREEQFDGTFNIMQKCHKCKKTNNKRNNLYSIDAYNICDCDDILNIGLEYKKGQFEEKIDNSMKKIRKLNSNKENSYTYYYYQDGFSFITFFIPMIIQDDLIVISQFAAVAYIDKDFNIRIKASNFKKDDISKNAILVFSKKFGNRYINKDQDRIIMTKNISKALITSIKQYANFWFEVEALSETFLNDLLSDNNLELNSKNLLNIYFNYIPEKARRKTGIYKHKKYIGDNKDKEIKKRIKEDIVKNVGSALILNRNNMKQHKMDFIVEDDLKFIHNEFTLDMICSKCYNISEVEIMNDQLCTDDLLLNERLKESESYKLSNISFNYDLKNEAVVCNQCQNPLSTHVSYTHYLYNDTIYMLYDKDQHGNLILRYFKFKLDYIYNSDETNNKHSIIGAKAKIEEDLNIILFKNSKDMHIYKYNNGVNPLDYVNKWRKVDYFEYNSTIQPIQTRGEILNILKDTPFEYSGIECVYNKRIFNEFYSNMNLLYSSYIFKWMKHPQIEKLARLDEFHILLYELLTNKTEDTIEDITTNGNKLNEVLKINKNSLHVLKNKDINIKNLFILQYIENISTNVYDINTIEKLFTIIEVDNKAFGISYFKANIIKEILKLQKDINRINIQGIIKYVNNAYKKQKISYATILRYWHDYLILAKKLNYNLNDKNVLYPHSLKREHDIGVYYYNVLKAQDINNNNEDIIESEHFGNLQQYNFKYKDFLIVAPKNKKDVIEEGINLNHCVGSYADAVKNGKSKILFIRKKDNPNKSLYTMEIANNHIQQVYGKYNSKVQDPKAIVFLHKFKEFFNLI